MHQKQALRNRFKQMRMQLSEREKEAANKAILDFVRTFDFGKNKTIHCFVPIAHLVEVNTFPLIDFLQAQGHTVCVPKVVGKHLEHYLWQGKSMLQEGSFGILEPSKGIQMDADEMDFVLVPLLAFDGQGNRLGYGKGFYDRFLAQCNPNCRFIGLNWFAAVDALPTQNHDQKLHFAISPEGIVGF